MTCKEKARGFLKKALDVLVLVYGGWEHAEVAHACVRLGTIVIDGRDMEKSNEVGKGVPGGLRGHSCTRDALLFAPDWDC